MAIVSILFFQQIPAILFIFIIQQISLFPLPLSIAQQTSLLLRAPSSASLASAQAPSPPLRQLQLGKCGSRLGKRERETERRNNKNNELPMLREYGDEFRSIYTDAAADGEDDAEDDDGDDDGAERGRTAL